MARCFYRYGGLNDGIRTGTCYVPTGNIGQTGPEGIVCNSMVNSIIYLFLHLT